MTDQRLSREIPLVGRSEFHVANVSNPGTVFGFEIERPGFGIRTRDRRGLVIFQLRPISVALRLLKHRPCFLRTRQPFDQPNANLTVDSTGTFNFKSNALTVPIELTTGFRLIELFSFYGGLGFDFTEGKAYLDANLNGTMKTPDGTSVGTVTISGTASNTASPGNFYALAGLQINLWALKIFSQVNLSPEPAASLAFGLRLVL